MAKTKHPLTENRDKKLFLFADIGEKMERVLKDTGDLHLINSYFISKDGR